MLSKSKIRGNLLTDKHIYWYTDYVRQLNMKMEEGKGTPDRSSNVENNNSGNTNGVNVPQEPPTREITQTDHLNKKLLNSFLDKINESSGFPVASRIDTDAEPEEDEWAPPADTNNKQA